MIILLLFTNGCVSKANNNFCPACPLPAPQVADELELFCNDLTCPHTLDFLNRFYKTCDILASESQD